MESKSSTNEATGKLCGILKRIYELHLLEYFYKAGEIVVQL